MHRSTGRREALIIVGFLIAVGSARGENVPEGEIREFAEGETLRWSPLEPNNFLLTAAGFDGAIVDFDGVPRYRGDSPMRFEPRMVQGFTVNTAPEEAIEVAIEAGNGMIALVREQLAGGKPLDDHVGESVTLRLTPSECVGFAYSLLGMHEAVVIGFTGRNATVTHFSDNLTPLAAAGDDASIVITPDDGPRGGGVIQLCNRHGDASMQTMTVSRAQQASTPAAGIASVALAICATVLAGRRR